MSPIDQTSFFKRDLSWLEFNKRVLAEAMDESNPLLERLKFLGIVSSNFDEFFMVRIASLYTDESEEGRELLQQVRSLAYEIIREQNEFFKNQLLPQLETAGIKRFQPTMLEEKQRQYLRSFFEKELYPLLTPIAIHEGKPMPNLRGLSLYRIVLLQKTGSKTQELAVIEIPRKLSRMVSLPGVGENFSFVLLEDVIALFASELFSGYEIIEQGLMRLTRAAELSIDEEKEEDFAKIMSEALRERNQSDIMRLEIDASQKMINRLIPGLDVSETEICFVSTWIDLKGISQLSFQPGFLDLKRPVWTPKTSPDFENADDIWKLLRSKDVILNHPYDSYDPVIQLISDAAQDPDVLAIKQTLYRTDGASLISALERAAGRGKQVTVLVELKARFDEEKNIEWAKRLESAGALVLYGVAGLKTHAKLCLIVRREPEGIKRYLHLGTGNYNEKTARLYSDISFFTSQDALTQDATALFNVITGFSQPTELAKMDYAPFGLRRKLLKLIEREMLRNSKDRPGKIMAKMNSLVDPEIIQALYNASQAGVDIQLNVRGVCCLRPGVKGLSENIHVTSIVDMFLEHSRIFYFQNGGDYEIYLSSADWMPRNIDRRIEIIFPVDTQPVKNELVDILKSYFKDNTKAWVLQSDGSYLKKEGKEKKFRVQEALCKKASERELLVAKKTLKEIKPQRPRREVKNSNTLDDVTPRNS